MPVMADGLQEPLRIGLQAADKQPLFGLNAAVGMMTLRPDLTEGR